MSKVAVINNPNLKDVLLKRIASSMDDMQRVSDEAAKLFEAEEPMPQDAILMFCADAYYAAQLARSCVYQAVNSDMCEEDASEIVVAAAGLYATADAIADFVEVFLDEDMDMADVVLDVALDEMEDEGDGVIEEPDVLDLGYVTQVLLDAGIVNEGDKINIQIFPADEANEAEEDEDEEDAEDVDEDDPTIQAAQDALEKLENYFARLGLLTDDHVMHIEIEDPADQE